jgi:creatinine amidohydrolase
MLLQHCTWPEVGAYLENSKAIIIPIGSTEQHGPNGLIGTDAITAEHIATAVGEAVGALVAPTINVGMAQHHMAFTGSMTLKPSTLIAVIRDNVESLARHGFDRFYFINGHGGNVSTANAAFQEIHAAASLGEAGNRPSLVCELRNWYMAPGVGALSKELYGDKEGSHATPSEVAVTQYLLPETIKDVPDFGPPSDSRPPFHDAEDYRRRFPDGRIRSWPQLATPEAGKRIFEAAVEGLAQDFREFADA